MPLDHQARRDGGPLLLGQECARSLEILGPHQDLAHAVGPEVLEGGVLLLGEAVGALDPVLAQELAESLGLRLALNGDHANAFVHARKRSGSAYAVRGASP